MSFIVLSGHVQDRETIEKIIHFAASERLVLLVEEVNTFCTDKFLCLLVFLIKILPFFLNYCTILGLPGQCVWTGQRVSLI